MLRQQARIKRKMPKATKPMRRTSNGVIDNSCFIYFSVFGRKDGANRVQRARSLPRCSPFSRRFLKKTLQRYTFFSKQDIENCPWTIFNVTIACKKCRKTLLYVTFVLQSIKTGMILIFYAESFLSKEFRREGVLSAALAPKTPLLPNSLEFLY